MTKITVNGNDIDTAGASLRYTKVDNQEEIGTDVTIINAKYVYVTKDNNEVNLR